MPFEVLADFKEREDASKIDKLWSGIARSLLMRLIEKEPLIRLRIRNFPPVVTLESGDRGTLAKSGIALSESDVPPLLRDRINIPEGKEYWIHNYRCMTCLDDEGKGTWVPHIRRKLHYDHDLKDLGITAKGIKQPWTTTHRLVIGDEKRIVGMGGLLYSVALTGPIKDLSNVKGFDGILLVPVQRTDLVAQNSQLLGLKQAGKIEGFSIMSPDPESTVVSLLYSLNLIDPKLLQPVENTENVEEDAEYKQQLAREKIARRMMAGMGQGKPVREVLKDK